MKKIALSIILIISIITINLNVCFASTSDSLPTWVLPIVSIAESIQQGAEVSSDMLKNSLVNGLRGVGFIANGVAVTTQSLIDYLRGYGNGQFTDNNTASDEEVIYNASEYFVNNVNITNNNISFNSNSRNILTGLANEIINNTGYIYVNSFRLTDSINTITDGYLYNAIRQWLNDNDYNLCVIQHLYNGNKYYLTGTNSDDIALIRGNSYNQSDGKWYQGSYYSYASWNPSSLGNYISNTYEYDSATKEFIESEYNMNIERSLFNDNENMSIPLMSQYTEFTISKEKRIYKLFNTVADFRASTQGLSTYYYNSNWQNFVSGSGNYTVDSSNSNNITYGDVTSYVNNYYGDNGTYPDPTQVQVYIDNNIVTPDPTPTPTPNPDDPGGGGGSDDDPTFDLGFLGTIGRLIGSLITGIGNLITGILEGIVNALTGILSFLTTLITDIADVMPQGIMDLFGAILGWLPQEWITVMSLGILSMVLIGVFKIFK